MDSPRSRSDEAYIRYSDDLESHDLVGAGLLNGDGRVWVTAKWNHHQRIWSENHRKKEKKSEKNQF